MAQGGELLEAKKPNEAATLNAFLETPTWLYPITRFLGHALRNYRYDIDFIHCETDDEDERNWILYDTYYDLVGCILGKFCHMYGLKPSKIISEVLAANAEPIQGVEAKKVRSYNFIRATYKAMPHFGYMLMSYCNLYKVKCCEDVKQELKQMEIVTSQRENWEGLWQYINEEMARIVEGQECVEEFLRGTDSTTMMIEEMQYGPFICAYGIKLHDSNFNYESNMDQTLQKMTDLRSRKESLIKETVPKSKKKAAKEKTPDDVTMLLGATKLDEESESLPSSEDDCDLRELKAKGQEQLDCVLVESPASRLFVTVSERLALVKSSTGKIEPPCYIVPSTPEKLESTGMPEFLAVTESVKSSSNSPETTYITAPSSPEKTSHTRTPEAKLRQTSPSLKFPSPPRGEPTQATKTSVATPTISRKKRTSKLRFVTAPSSPSQSPESPQTLKRLSRMRKAASPEKILTLPTNDRERKEFLLNEYDKRMKKQLAFMAATFLLQSAIGVKQGLEDLVKEQRWFEKKWLSPQGEARKHKEDIKITPGRLTAIEKRELGMLDDVFSGQALLEALWKVYDARMSKKSS